MKTFRKISAYLLPILLFLILPSYINDYLTNNSITKLLEESNTNELFLKNLAYEKDLNYVIGMLISIVISIIIGYLIEPNDKRKLSKWLSLILSMLGIFSVYGIVKNENLQIIGPISIVIIAMLTFTVFNQVSTYNEKKQLK